jgi:uncharacterized coiled-coil protein SlyX
MRSPLNTDSIDNTAIGWGALAASVGFNGIGNNTAVGSNALASNTTGHDNIALGESAGNAIITAHDVICIGHPEADVSNSCFIGHVRNVTTVNSAIPVVIATDGQLGTTSSSKRFKKDIQRMDKASETILALKPVSFQYKSDKTNTPHFGLIAEEVAQVNPDLVVRDENGEIYTVRYEAINAMLLNEFLKEHKKVDEQQASIAQLKSTVAKQEATIARQQKSLERNLTEQEKQIAALRSGLQKVTAQMDTMTPATQMVFNEP